MNNALDILRELHESSAAAADCTNRVSEQRGWRALQAFASMAIDNLEDEQRELESGVARNDNASDDFIAEAETRPGVDVTPATKPERVAELERELRLRDEKIVELERILAQIAAENDRSDVPTAATATDTNAA